MKLKVYTKTGEGGRVRAFLALPGSATVANMHGWTVIIINYIETRNLAAEHIKSVAKAQPTTQDIQSTTKHSTYLTDTTHSVL